ncbi:FadR/GntR family transcriptional regulator [Paenibacillus lignilyticus]|uniref:FadR family transcriptional regulator n=1 Tax=Paenibacillus lignilyticus TaxID=1172615 RepID=A0ABS5C873_9BACL|nr:FadR/GntR family transcriptional regulator [Paenibacillus lignilyticus]MBP3962025.1 FadR family transcriptional regulator [Paenibacillus lignilyticus]
MKKIQKILVHEQVSQEIQNFIEEKELSEGDKLPSVEEMTQMFGVGRSSLREALRYLEAMDIIQVHNGKGIFVKDVNTFRFTGKVKIEREKNFLLSILEVRRALEGQAVALASKRITSKKIAEVEECLEEYRILKEGNKDTSQVDLAFHHHIIKAANNPVLETVLDSISGLYEKFFNDPLGDKQLFDETYPFHITMFKGIAEHDTRTALEEFSKLMDCIEEKIKSAK